jgi:hypothetical protein
MGYRLYLGLLSKSKHDEIKNLSLKEIYDLHDEDIEDGYVSPNDIIEKQLYELGSYVDFDDDKFYKRVFNLDEVNNRFIEEDDFWIVEKDFLEHIINSYNNRVKNYYNEMMKPFINTKNNPSEFLNTIKRTTDGVSFDFSKISQEETDAFWKMLEHIRSMRIEWCALTPFDFKKDDKITKSYKFEYAIFELIRIYKTFDWENNLLIYYGY